MRATQSSKRTNGRRKKIPQKSPFLYLGFQSHKKKKERREKRGDRTFFVSCGEKGDFSSLLPHLNNNTHYLRTLLYLTLHSSSSWLRRRHKNFSPRTTASTVRTRKRGLFFFFRFVMNRRRYNFILLLLNMYNTFTHPIRRALLSLFFNDKNETGVTLYHNWVTYYGPKGIMPYFLKTEGPVALVRSRW